MAKTLQTSVQIASRKARKTQIPTATGGGALTVRQQYDVVSAQRNPAGGRKRRQGRIETKDEDGIFQPRHRLIGANLVRDTLRNAPQARGMAKTLRVNVVGNFGKLRFQTSGEWYRSAQDWFNGKWGRTADFLDNSSWRECLQLVVYAISHEGDFVCIFDDGILSGIPGGTGKLAFFEGDQICNLTDRDFKPFSARGYTQSAGIIRDRLGREVGVICTRNRGQVETPMKEALILTRNPDAPFASVPWVFVRRKFRLRQGRGTGDALTSLQTVIDSYEMLGYEMQTAKAAASRYATVFESDSAAGEPEGFAELEGVPGEEGTAPTAKTDADPLPEELEPSAQALERYTGGNVDYLGHDDKIEFDPANRPNSQLEPFLDYTTDVAGSAHGLAHAYARNRADTSYTAFRGDMVMTWMCFTDFQQFIEDGFSDWAAVNAIRWALRRNMIPGPAPEGWEGKIAWQYPRMPAVDEAKEQRAKREKFKNGLTRFREEIGPNWREHMDDLAEEIAYAREKNLPLSIFETASGGAATTNPDDDGSDPSAE